MRVVALLLTVLLAGCMSPAQDPLSDGVSAAEMERFASFAPAPLTGHGKSLAELQGNVTLVFIWASWCSVCKADEPTLEEVHAEYAPRGFEIMAVSRELSRNDAQDYADQEGWAFPAYWDTDAPQQMGLRNYQPGYVLFDRDGAAIWTAEQGLRGGGLDELRSEIEQAL